MSFDINSAQVRKVFQTRPIYDFECSTFDKQQVIRPRAKFKLVVDERSTDWIDQEASDLDIQSALNSMPDTEDDSFDVTGGVICGIGPIVYQPLPDIKIVVDGVDEKDVLQPIRISLGEPSKEHIVVSAQHLDPQLSFVVDQYYQECLTDMCDSEQEKVTYTVAGDNYRFTPTKSQIWEAAKLTVCTNFAEQDDHLKVKGNKLEPSVRYTAVDWMKLSKVRGFIYSAALSFCQEVHNTAPKKRRSMTSTS